MSSCCLTTKITSIVICKSQCSVKRLHVYAFWTYGDWRLWIIYLFIYRVDSRVLMKLFGDYRMQSQHVKPWVFEWKSRDRNSNIGGVVAKRHSFINGLDWDVDGMKSLPFSSHLLSLSLSLSLSLPLPPFTSNSTSGSLTRIQFSGIFSNVCSSDLAIRHGFKINNLQSSLLILILNQKKI